MRAPASTDLWQAARKYGLEREPKLVELIAALPDALRPTLAPLLRAKPVRTASGIAVRTRLL